MTRNELAYCDEIRQKDAALRTFLAGHTLANPPEARAWFDYLTQVKDIQGNLNNSATFLATLLAKGYLEDRFGSTAFDAAAKPMGAGGPDLQITTLDGRRIVAEIKTTHPYQPGFGAAQKKEIRKDLDRLASSNADHRLMMVTDAAAYRTLCGHHWDPYAYRIEIVNLLTRETFQRASSRWPSRPSSEREER